jgi:hypothetical protein
LAPSNRLEFAVADAAEGIAKAVASLAAGRRDDPRAPPLEHGLDGFHTAMEAERVRAGPGRRVAAAPEEAEAADEEVADAKRQGVDARGVARAARAAWGRAIAPFEQTEHLEAARARPHAALDLFRADGRLNDRSGARCGDRRGPEEIERPRVVEGR